MERNLLIIGKGYTGEAMLALARRMGWRARATSRSAPDAARFDNPALLEGVTHLAITAPPGPAGDPVWATHGAALRAAPLAWVGYISTTGVYGDRKGEWVDETSHPNPGQERSRRRVEAEQQWAGLGMDLAVDIFRTGGIYGPGRSALDDVRSGTARRVVRPSHAFSRYVTLLDLAHMVRAGRDFVVYDAKSGDDITRSVLTQIIVEEESKGSHLLPESFLRQLIGFYGDSLQGVLPRYLEATMTGFSRQ